MKRVLAILVSLLTFTIVWGQKYTSLEFLAGELAIDYDFDFTNATILGIDAEDYISTNPKWDEEVLNMRNRFMTAFQQAVDDSEFYLKLVNNLDSDIKYTLLLRVFDVTEKGSHIQGEYQFRTKNGEVVFADSFNAEKGVFGTATNLMGDAFSSLGNSIGSNIGNYYYEKGNKKILDQLALAIKDRVPVTVNVVVTESVKKELRRKNKNGKISDHLTEEMAIAFSEGFNDYVSQKKKGKYNGVCTTGLTESTDYSLTIIIRQLSGTITLALTCDDKEFFGKYTCYGGEGKEPPYDVLDELAENLCNRIKL